MFVVCYCGRFQADPREPHMMAVKKILSYLKRTTSLSLWYPSNSGFFVQAYSDADLGGCELDRKNTSKAKYIATCVSLSTAKAKYIATTSCTSQVVWIQNQLHQLDNPLLD